MTNKQFREENAALVALLRTCSKPDTWHTIADKVQREHSALALWNHKIDPEQFPLSDEDYQYEGGEQEPLFIPEEDRKNAAEHRQKLSDEFSRALADVDAWSDEGKDFVTVLDERFPNSLRNIVDIPPFLFAAGRLIQDEQGVSIVGSRKATPEALEFARQASSMVVEEGLTVIAGLADGIDAAAHSQALHDGGRTVAFIGTGINKSYPAKNRALQEQIKEQGLVLSQFWPDSPPSRISFPMRNALMSGYGIATVVVEANEHSGTRIQARQAQNHGRPVIIRREVTETTKWAADLVNRPGIYVVDEVDDLKKCLAYIRGRANNLESLLESLLDSNENLSWSHPEVGTPSNDQCGQYEMAF